MKVCLSFVSLGVDIVCIIKKNHDFVYALLIVLVARPISHHSFRL